MIWFMKKLGKDISLKNKIIEFYGSLKVHFGLLLFAIKKGMIRQSFVITIAIIKGLLVGFLKKYN